MDSALECIGGIEIAAEYLISSAQFHSVLGNRVCCVFDYLRSADQIDGLLSPIVQPFGNS